mgnify:CR=1 FL=1
MTALGKRSVFFVIIVFIFTVAACDTAPPELQQVYWQLNVKNDVVSLQVYETLSVWVQARDEDGPDDLDYIYLIHDESELMWEISADVWNEAEQQGERWYGTNELVQADLSNFPRGEYRIVVLDTAGERDERTIYISLQKNITEPAQLPEAESEEGGLAVSKAPFGFTIWGYNEDGNFIASIRDRSKPVPFEELEEQIPGMSSFSIYSYNINDGYGMVSGMYEYVPLVP